MQDGFCQVLGCAIAMGGFPNDIEDSQIIVNMLCNCCGFRANLQALSSCQHPTCGCGVFVQLHINRSVGVASFILE